MNLYIWFKATKRYSTASIVWKYLYRSIQYSSVQHLNINPYCYCPIENSPNIKLHCYRAIMEVFIRHIDPSLVLAAIRCKKIKNASAMEFEEYMIFSIYSVDFLYLVYPLSNWFPRGPFILKNKIQLINRKDWFLCEKTSRHSRLFFFWIFLVLNLLHLCKVEKCFDILNLNRNKITRKSFFQQRNKQFVVVLFLFQFI